MRVCLGEWIYGYVPGCRNERICKDGPWIDISTAILHVKITADGETGVGDDSFSDRKRKNDQYPTVARTCGVVERMGDT